jgi:RNA polymerase sigma-70 factor (sigma-E family)
VDEIGLGEASVSRSEDRMAELYAAHAPDAYRLAYLLIGDGHAAADVVQDAFVRLFGRFRDLRDPDAFRSYLRKTVVNLSRDRFRKVRSDRKRLARELSLRMTAVPEVPDVESRDLVIRAIRRLPQRQQAAVVLRYYEDLSEQATADALGCSVSAVKGLLLRATKALKELLGGDA